MENKKRDVIVDYLRIIGLVLVIAAHCRFPYWFIYGRQFDVPLLFFVSGMSFGYASFSFTKENYISYVKKRFLKLIGTVWIFLVFFFLFFQYVDPKGFDASTIIQSFLLTGSGIMFVWVYRIFFTNAITLPLLNQKEYGKPLLWGFLIYVGIFLNELLHIGVGSLLQGTAYKLFEYVISYTIAYTLIGQAGVFFTKMNQKEKGIYSIVSIVLFLLVGWYNHFIDFEMMKYPPTLYYASYGIAWSSFLYVVLAFVIHKENPLITWLSNHVMDIYLAHIFLYYFVAEKISVGIVQLCTLTVGSCLLAYVITWLQDKMKRGYRL